MRWFAVKILTLATAVSYASAFVRETSTSRARFCSLPRQTLKSRRLKLSPIRDHDINQRLPLRSSQLEWDGDDLRYLSRLKRRIRRSSGGSSGRLARDAIILLSSLVFVYQTVDAVRWIARRHPSYWPGNAPYMIFDVLMGNTSPPGPFERDFVFHNRLARFQPHRYLTGSLLHRGLLHFALNMNELRRQPSWLETGLGRGLYLTTYLVSIVAGCLGRAGGAATRTSTRLLMGAGPGICGLYGLMWVSLIKMGNQRASTKALVGLAIVVLYSSLLLEDAVVSNGAHLAGFFSGMLCGVLFGPSYSGSYAMRRKWSTYVDTAPADYRAVMGFGFRATKRGMIPMSLLWILVGSLLLIVPSSRSIPATILRGLTRPGSLS